MSSPRRYHVDEIRMQPRARESPVDDDVPRKRRTRSNPLRLTFPFRASTTTSARAIRLSRCRARVWKKETRETEREREGGERKKKGKRAFAQSTTRVILPVARSRADCEAATARQLHLRPPRCTLRCPPPPLSTCATRRARPPLPSWLTFVSTDLRCPLTAFFSRHCVSYTRASWPHYRFLEPDSFRLRSLSRAYA